MGEKDLKVTDKRMFTADGELREEYRHLEDDAAEPVAGDRAPSAAPPPEPVAAEPEPEADAGPAARSVADEARDAFAQAPAGDSPRLEIPGTPEGLGAPGFLDLVTLLAEPIALYLGDVTLPDGESAENLEMARLYIDLLEVLRRKTAGNLDIEESRLLDDLLYRCRLRYVQKRG